MCFSFHQYKAQGWSCLRRKRASERPKNVAVEQNDHCSKPLLRRKRIITSRRVTAIPSSVFEDDHTEEDARLSILISWDNHNEEGD